MTEWLIGFGLAFGFGLLMAYYLNFTLENFLGFSAMFCSFCVYMELLPIWVLVLMFLGLFVIVLLDFSKSRMGMG